jgi:hypothetical protein
MVAFILMKVFIITMVIGMVIIIIDKITTVPGTSARPAPFLKHIYGSDFPC